MGLRDWLTGGPPLFRSALLQAPAPPPPEQKLYYLPGTQVAMYEPYGGMLVHGPNATALLHSPRQADGNSIVLACLRVLADGYIEPPLRVYRVAGDAQTAQPAHPLQRLLDRPNPGMTGREVRRWLRWVCHLEGNAYLRKVRAGNRRTGNVVELWPMSPTRVELRTERAGDYVTAYRYHHAAGQYVDLPPENVLHFRLGLDDADHRRGLSLIRRLVAQLTTDWHAVCWANALLQNGATPNAVLETDAELTQADADALKARLQTVYGGGQQGGVAVLGNGAKWKSIGFKPEEMATRELHRLAEERISACFGPPAILAGLGVGLDRSTFNNTRELGEMFTERVMMPLWQVDQDKWQEGLAADFGLGDRLVVAHDLADVRAMQEDRDAQYKRLDTAVKGGWMTVNEARAEAGLPDLPTGEVLMIPAQSAPTPVAHLATPTATPSPAVPDKAGDDIPAAFRNMGGPLGEHKQDDRADPAEITDADLAAWRARGRALGLSDFVEAVAVNGSNGHAAD